MIKKFLIFFNFCITEENIINQEYISVNCKTLNIKIFSKKQEEFIEKIFNIIRIANSKNLSEESKNQIVFQKWLNTNSINKKTMFYCHTIYFFTYFIIFFLYFYLNSSLKPLLKDKNFYIIYFLYFVSSLIFPFLFSQYYEFNSKNIVLFIVFNLLYLYILKEIYKNITEKTSGPKTETIELENGSTLTINNRMINPYENDNLTIIIGIHGLYFIVYLLMWSKFNINFIKNKLLPFANKYKPYIKSENNKLYIEKNHINDFSEDLKKTIFLI